MGPSCRVGPRLLRTCGDRTVRRALLLQKAVGSPARPPSVRLCAGRELRSGNRVVSSDHRVDEQHNVREYHGLLIRAIATSPTTRYIGYMEEATIQPSKPRSAGDEIRPHAVKAG